MLVEKYFIVLTNGSYLGNFILRLQDPPLNKKIPKNISSKKEKKAIMEITKVFSFEYEVAIKPHAILIEYNNKTLFLCERPKATR